MPEAVGRIQVFHLLGRQAFFQIFLAKAANAVSSELFAALVDEKAFAPGRFGPGAVLGDIAFQQADCFRP